MPAAVLLDNVNQLNSLMQGNGAGELLVSLLGIPLTGLGFVVYKNRRHINLPAVIGTAVVSLAFTVASTVGVARLTGMSDGEWLLPSTS